MAEEAGRSRDASPPSVEEGAHKRTREVTVTDEEVEEFCAILRRLKRPVKYFGSGGGRVKRWRPSFVVEDFNGVDCSGNDIEKAKDGVGKLDLNVHPFTE